MTADDWWEQIERHLLDRNWTGVLVCADGLQEAGEERLAGTLRWVVRKELHINWMRNGSDRNRWWFCYVGDDLFDGDDIVVVVGKIQSKREYYL